MWKNILEHGRPQTTKWRMRIACWITKAPNTHPECVISLFHCNNGRTNAPHCYVIRTLAVLFHSSLFQEESPKKRKGHFMLFHYKSVTIN